MNQTIFNYLKENWAFLASVGYLYLTCVGMVLSWSLYDTYGVNIFEFAELNDFLLAAFREPITIASGAISALYFVGIYALLLRKVESTFFDIVRRWFPFTVIIVSAIAPIALYFYTSEHRHYEDMLWERQVTVELRKGALGVRSNPDKAVDYYLIGASDKFIFVLNGNTETAVVIPVSNLVSISFVRKKEEIDRIISIYFELDDQFSDGKINAEQLESRLIELGAPLLWVKREVIEYKRFEYEEKKPNNGN